MVPNRTQQKINQNMKLARNIRTPFFLQLNKFNFLCINLVMLYKTIIFKNNNDIKSYDVICNKHYDIIVIKNYKNCNNNVFHSFYIYNLKQNGFINNKKLIL
jgi:hypothetical protein